MANQIIKTRDNNLLIELHPKRKWIFGSNSHRTVCLFGFVDDLTSDELITVLLALCCDELIEFLSARSGQFLFIISDDQFTLCATDPAGTCQLLWTELNNKLCISDNLISLENLLGLDRMPINERVAVSFAMSGYSIADKTIYECANSLMPGHYLIKKNSSIK